MFAANTYSIHLATEEDLVSLNGLAELGARGPLNGPALIGYIGGEPAAALSLDDRRIVTAPQRRTDHLVACLRVRADALRAYDENPSLPARILAALSATDHAPSTAERPSTRRRGSGTNTTAAKRSARRRVLAAS